MAAVRSGSGKTGYGSDFFSLSLDQCCGSRSAWIRNFCVDPDPELLFRTWIQQKMKE